MREVILNPNIIYLIVLFALWISVMAAYVPGTGVAEVFAFGLLMIGVLALTAMSTNWIAVVLLMGGVLGFLVMPLVRPQLSRYAIGGLVLQAVGGFFLFNNASVSVVLIVLTLGISLAYYRYGLLPLLAAQRRKAVVNEDDLLIGTVGRVVKPLEPTGTVNVNGELWSAISDKPLQTGEDVVVLERDGLQLYVEAVKHKRAPQPQNNHHEEVI